MPSIMESVSGKLRKLRTSRGLTQEQLGEKAGLNPSFIGQVERGLRKPSIASLERIACALDVSLRALFRDPDSEEEKALQDLEILLAGSTVQEIRLASKLVQVFLDGVRELAHITSSGSFPNAPADVHASGTVPSER